MSSPSQYVFPTQVSDNSSDAVAYHSHDSWDAPALTYSGASSPASSTSSPSTSPSTPGSLVDSEPFISESGSPKSQQQGQGHIPRPRNAFIIFRSFFYAKTRENENNINQNALSCAAAAAWKALSEDKKKTFRKQAEDEKLMHYKKHPNYVYTPLNRAVKRAQKVKASKTTTTTKGAKRPAKKHRSSLSQRSRKAESLRSKPRHSTSDDSLRDKSSSKSGFVLFDDIPDLELVQDEECCDGIKTDGESQKRVDVQFGQRPDVAFTQLPPTPTDTDSPCEPTSSYSSSPTTVSELSTSSDTSLCHNPGYPNWMYNELLGYGMPDTGLHAGWNPLQTTLNSYGDNYFDHDRQLLHTGNDLDDFSRYVNYDNVDTTTTTASADYSDFRETTGADVGFTSFPSLDYDGNWVGV